MNDLDFITAQAVALLAGGLASGEGNLTKGDVQDAVTTVLAVRAEARRQLTEEKTK